VTLLCLTALLTGCGKRLEVKPIVTERIVVERVQVPAQLLEPCEIPSLDDLETTGDIEAAAIEALQAARCGNEDKAAIAEWMQTL
jgi:hypothetical protein